jgi:phosphomannomutase
MITFGTDGWRGLIARDFSFDNIRLVALATARFAKKVATDGNPSIVIGYDTRFLSGNLLAKSPKCLLGRT